MGRGSGSGADAKTWLHGCATSCMKCVFGIFNTLLFLAGCGLIVLGVIFLVARHWIVGVNESFESLMLVYGELKLNTMAYIFIGVGVAIVFMCIWGCISVTCENRCGIVTFVIFLIVVFLLEIGISVLVVLYDYNFGEDEMKNEFMNSTLHTGDYTDLGRAFGKIQYEDKCCGVSGPEDYDKHRHGHGWVFHTCCIPVIPPSDPVGTNDWKTLENTRNALNWTLCRSKTPDYIYEVGCHETLYDKLDTSKTWHKILIGLAFGFLAVEIVLVVIGFCFCCETCARRSEEKTV